MRRRYIAFSAAGEDSLEDGAAVDPSDSSSHMDFGYDRPLEARACEGGSRRANDRVEIGMFGNEAQQDTRERSLGEE